jgi:hypothetical protein
MRDRRPMEVADDLGHRFLAITSVWPTIQPFTDHFPMDEDSRDSRSFVDNAV